MACLIADGVSLEEGRAGENKESCCDCVVILILNRYKCIEIALVVQFKERCDLTVARSLVAEGR